MAGIIAPPNYGPGSMIGNRAPTTEDELLRQTLAGEQAETGPSGTSILMDLIRRLMDEGDYEALSKILPQMYPEPAAEDLGAPPGPVLPMPEEELPGYGEYGGEGIGGEFGDFGGLMPGELEGLQPAPPSGGNWPQNPLTPGPATGQYTNPSVADLPGLLAGPQDQGFAPAPPEPQLPGFSPFPTGPMDQGFAPAPPEPPLPGMFGGAPDMRQPGMQPELPPWILQLLGVQSGQM